MDSPFLLLPLLFGWLWVTLKGADAWPLSSYGMFAKPYRLSDVAIYAVACEDADGSVSWWRPHYGRYAEEIGRQLAFLGAPSDDRPTVQAARAMKLRMELGHVLRLATLQHGVLPPWRALHVIERRISSVGRQITIREQVVATVPVDTLDRFIVARD